MYSMYRLSAQEFVGILDEDLAEATGHLTRAGYDYQLLAATKLHPETEEYDDGSYRLINHVDPAKQWHVHLWESDDGVECFSHYEYKPEPWNPWDHDRVFEHYRPDYGTTYIQGQHSHALKRLLKEHGIYEGDEGKLGSTELGPTR